ncbi:MAG: hypothetical protein JWO52_4185, partial [Gammaproteobacteria bacterium]|nr:hypothetical protein [Gammaproteobacteria bacterium]
RGLRQFFLSHEKNFFPLEEGIEFFALCSMNRGGSHESSMLGGMILL